MNTYQRVIPRDFFNEAKLLKCMGQLALKAHDGMLPEGMRVEIGHIEDTTSGFLIHLMPSFPALTVINYIVLINDIQVLVATTYNSKSPYPLFAYYDDEIIDVFDDNGEFTPEFAALRHIGQPG